MQVYNQTNQLVQIFQAHKDYILRIKQSPYNGRYVATASGDRTVKIWDSSNETNWNLIRTYTGHSGRVPALEFMNEDLIASGSEDCSIKIWSIPTGTTQMTINTGQDVWSLSMLNDGSHLASGLFSGNVNIYNINTGSLKASLKGHTGKVNDLALFTTNDKSKSDLLASSSDDSTIRIWNLTANTNRFILKVHTSAVAGLKKVSSDVLASGSMDKSIRLTNITSGQLIRTLNGHTDRIEWGLDLVEDDGKTLVSGSFDASLKFWNTQTGQLLNTINGNLTISALAVLRQINPTISTTKTTTLHVTLVIKIIKAYFYFKKFNFS
jgi:WD40 repeat protein